MHGEMLHRSMSDVKAWNWFRGFRPCVPGHGSRLERVPLRPLNIQEPSGSDRVLERVRPLASESVQAFLAQAMERKVQEVLMEGLQSSPPADSGGPETASGS